MKQLLTCIVFVATVALPAIVSAEGRLDWEAPDPVVSCFGSERGENNEWLIAGPPFRFQGPLKPPGELWPRPRRTCGPFELSAGAQITPKATANETFSLDLDMRLARAAYFFTSFHVIHQGGENWLFENMPIGFSFVPPINLFNALFAFEVRGLMPTATYKAYRAWGVGGAVSAVYLFTDWFEGHLWLGPDFRSSLETDVSDFGFTTQLGVQVYPIPWVSLVFDQRIRAADYGEYFPALALRGVYEFIGVEIGGGYRVPFDGALESSLDTWLRLSFLFGASADEQ